MNKSIFFLLSSMLILFFGCNENPENQTRKPQGAMAESSGRINHLTVVMENDLWEGEVGEFIRKHLAATVDGLPQEEPLFTMRQMPTEAFAGFARKNRTFLQIEKVEGEVFETLNNKFATPQVGVVIRGRTNAKIISTLEEQMNMIVRSFKNAEIKRKQSQIAKSLETIPSVAEKLDVEIKLPSIYRIAKETEDFFWIRKDIQQGSLNLIIYELPGYAFKKDSSVISQLIKIRDSVGSQEILTDEGGKFITEEAYAPYLFETRIDKKFTYETKGTWEVKNKFMAGPFVNYTIEDKKNNRFLVLEGFVFAPSVAKRDYIFELEAIIRSAKLL